MQHPVLHVYESSGPGHARELRLTFYEKDMDSDTDEVRVEIVGPKGAGRGVMYLQPGTLLAFAKQVAEEYGTAGS